MFCPKCGVYLRDTDLIQRNVKFAMGNVPVEYDARCPNCSVEIGHMSWGQFIIHPELEPTHYKDAPQFPEKKRLIPQPPEMRTVLRQYGSAGRTQPAQQETAKQDQPKAPAEEQPTRICPHCGQPWPEEDADRQKY